MRNKILITGSNGLLGLSLRNFFLNRNFVIVATGRGPDKFLTSPHLYLNLDIESKEESEMLKFKNFGRKSLTELTEKLTQLDLKFGMDITPYIEE